MSARRHIAVFAWAQGILIAEFALLFIVTAILARLLGPSEYGTYAMVVAAVGTAVALTALGLEEYVGRETAVDVSSGASQQLSWALTMRLVIGACSVPVIAGIAALFGGLRVGIVALAASSLFAMTGLTSFYWAILLAESRTKPAAAIRLIGLMAFCVSGTLTAALGLGYPAVLVASAASATITVLVYASYVRIPIMLRNPSLRDLRSFCIPVALLNATNFVLGKTVDVFLIGLLVSSAQAGFYSIAVGLVASADTLMLSALGRLALPSFVRAERSSVDDLARACESQICLNLFASLPLVSALLAANTIVVRYVFGRAYEHVVGLVIIVAAFSVTSRSLGGGIQITVLLAQGRQRVALLLRLAFAVLNVVFDIALIPVFGAVGAAIATGSTGVLLMLAEWYFVRQTLSVKYPTRIVGPVLAAVIALDCVAIAFSGLTAALTLLFAIFVTASVVAVIYVATRAHRTILLKGLRFAPEYGQTSTR